MKKYSYSSIIAFLLILLFFSFLELFCFYSYLSERFGAKGLSITGEYSNYINFPAILIFFGIIISVFKDSIANFEFKNKTFLYYGILLAYTMYIVTYIPIMYSIYLYYHDTISSSDFIKDLIHYGAFSIIILFAIVVLLIIQMRQIRHGKSSRTHKK